MKSEEILQEEIGKVKKAIAECDRLFEHADTVQQQKLKEKRSGLEALRDRRTSALDLVMGKNFNLYTIEGSMVIVQPSEWTAKMVKAAEERGARVISYGELGRSS